MSKFEGGRNIAMKIPPHQFDETVRFYREVIGLKEVAELAPSVVFEFGANRLWLDRVETLSQAEVWLELRAGDTRSATKHLEAQRVVRCDPIERLPPDFDGCWILNPAGIVHLVRGPEQDD
jgi:catechol 2,3-dioxygenase-like lactoylglutathione lyase family enzyme